MANVEMQRPASLGRSIRSLAHKWGWFVLLGALLIVSGIIALVTIVPATLVSVLWIGAMLFVVGISEVIAAFQFKDWGRFGLWLLLGLLYLGAGLMVFANPLLAAASLTLLIGIALIVGGLVRIYLGAQMKDTSSWLAVALSGVITALLGFLIVLQWPLSGLYVLGIFLGVDMLFAGVGWLSTGLAIRRLTDGR